MSESAVKIDDKVISPLNIPAAHKPGAPFYEVWFFKVKLPDKRGHFWGRMTTLTNPKKKKISEIWGIVHLDQRIISAKQTFPLTDFSFEQSSGSERIRIKNALWGARTTEGMIESTASAPSIAWNLNYVDSFGLSEPGIDYVPHLAKTFHLNKSNVLTPHPALLFSGQIRIGDETLILNGEPGMQGHVHGVKYAKEWVWAHAFDPLAPFVFEGVSARLPLFAGIHGLFSLFYFHFDGTTVCINSLWNSLKAKSRFSTEGWAFRARQGERCYDGRLITSRPLLAKVPYEDTDGSQLICHSSPINHLSLDIFKNGKIEKRVELKDVGTFEYVHHIGGPQ